MNCIIEIAKKQKRDYITPEDVADSLANNSVQIVRFDLLEILAKQTEFGAEDAGLCAYIAWKGGSPLIAGK